MFEEIKFIINSFELGYEEIEEVLNNCLGINLKIADVEANCYNIDYDCYDSYSIYFKNVGNTLLIDVDCDDNVLYNYIKYHDNGYVEAITIEKDEFFDRIKNWFKY